MLLLLFQALAGEAVEQPAEPDYVITVRAEASIVVVAEEVDTVAVGAPV
jgi:hypothetical protein